MTEHEIEASRPGSNAAAVPVPLPTELPPPPDLSHLPAHVLHSGTVETLIGQNEDLFARLKVNIRRNSVLEGQILEHERMNGELMRANQSLMSQLQILQEKDQIWREKTTRAESSASSLKDETAQLKARNRELLSSFRYQRRIRRWVQPFIDRLKMQLASERKSVLMKEAMISDLKARLAETSTHAQSLELQSTKNQARLVERYESQMKTLSNELEKLRSETKLFRDKASRVDQATAAEASSQNKIVYLERQNAELQANLEKYRKEAKQLAAEAVGHESEIKRMREESETLRDQLARSQDQFESLQAVWSDTQKRLESAKLQHESLNKLNQELSRQLKEMREAGSGPQVEGNC